MENSKSPKDRFFITYVLFYALGVVTLVPFSFFTTATDYWMYKFRNPESDENYHSENRTQLQAEFTADFTIVAFMSSAVFIILTFVFIRKFSIQKRIISTLCATTALFLVTNIFTKVDTDSWQFGFMVMTLMMGSSLTGLAGIFFVTIFELAAKFPPSYLAAILSGQAICGILAAILEIISLTIDRDKSNNGVIYFVTGMVFVILTLLGFLWCSKQCHFFKHHFTKEAQPQSFDKKKFVFILRKVKFYIAAMLISAGSTIMMHPGVTSLVVSVNKENGNKWNDVYFVPVITFLVYCTSDYIGRELATILKKPSNEKVLLTASCLRLIFIPMLMLCNAQPRAHLPVVFHKDYVYIILIIIFSWTNGFLINLCIIYVSAISTDEEKPVAMFFVLITMIVVLTICSFVGTGLVRAL